MKKYEWIKVAGTAVLSAVVSLAAVGLSDLHTHDQTDDSPNYTAQSLSAEGNTAPQITSGYEPADIAASVMPSVVGIAAGNAIGSQSRADRDESLQWSMGSGIIVSKTGHILTNQHVAGSTGTRLVVTFSDGSSKEARLVWGDASLDLAIIKVNGSDLPVAPLGDVASMRVGDRVLAIGNPLSMQFQRTVTGGLVSAVNRTIALQNEDGSQYYMDGLLQTDASINPGNSGGPLVNAAGEVVGINTIKVSSAEGIGFAIPINIARPVIEAYQAGRTFQTPQLGLYGQDNRTGRYMGSPSESEVGITVTTVSPGSAAQQAGIQVGDIITHVNRTAVNTMTELREQLFRSEPTCVLTLIQNDSVREVTVRLRTG